jgi:hypothetical protein
MANGGYAAAWWSACERVLGVTRGPEVDELHRRLWADPAWRDAVNKGVDEAIRQGVLSGASWRGCIAAMEDFLNRQVSGDRPRVRALRAEQARQREESRLWLEANRERLDREYRQEWAAQKQADRDRRQAERDLDRERAQALADYDGPGRKKGRRRRGGRGGTGRGRRRR